MREWPTQQQLRRLPPNKSMLLTTGGYAAWPPLRSGLAADGHGVGLPHAPVIRVPSPSKQRVAQSYSLPQRRS